MSLVVTRRARVITVIMLLIAATILIWPTSVQSINKDSDIIKAGPYVDQILFEVIRSDDAQMLALMNDEIDIVGDFLHPAFLPAIESELTVHNTLYNGYIYATINCAKYPFNCTAFRRALAFALDKEAICDDAWDGLAVPLDSCIPRCNPLSTDGLLPYNYYEANASMGNRLLDLAGFIDWDEDGVREAPDGTDFDVHVWTSSSAYTPIVVGNIIVEAFLSLGVDAVSYPVDWFCGWDILDRVYFHGDYDMAVLTTRFDDLDVDWLAYEFWSGFSDEPYHNLPNFRNDSYDSWRGQLLHSTDYSDIYEAAIEMQKIWVYECPMIICSEKTLLSAHNSKRVAPLEPDTIDSYHGWWASYKAHRLESNGGPFGGTLRVGISQDIESFNPMTCSSASSRTIHELLWDSLMRRGPDGYDIPWIAQSYMTETHNDNPAVPEGHKRFTFDLIQNATHSDGRPLTADDVAFTLNYYRDAPDNPYRADLMDMTAAYAPSTYQVVIEFNSESYWHIHDVAYKPILPKHIFFNITPESWDEWTPSSSEADNDGIVTSGPFRIGSYVEGESITLTANPQYCYRLEPLSTDEASTMPSSIESLLIAVGSGTGSMSAVLMIGILAIWRKDV